MNIVFVLAALVVIGFVLLRWYRAEQIFETDATVRLQSEHEHFHFHVDLPTGYEILPGDTLHILNMPEEKLDAGRTEGEIVYTSPVRLHRASKLQRYLTKTSSIVEVNELVDHP